MKTRAWHWILIGWTTLAAASHMMAATYFLRPDGDDAASGDAAHPWRSPADACARLRPGDELVVRGGIYFLDTPLRLRTGGEPTAWITLRAAPGEVPFFDGSAWMPERPEGLGETGLIHIEGPSYLRLIGLHVGPSRGSGICVRKPSTYIDVERCQTYLTYSPGISAWNTHHVRVRGCDVARADDPSLRLPAVRDQHENPHEAISFGSVEFFEIAWNHVHDSVKEGIDAKETSAHGAVHHNYVHGLQRQALYTDAWFGRLEDVQIHHNVAHDCEWGVVISVEGQGASMQNVQVTDNLLYRHRASGIYFGTWGENGPRRDILIAHNTVWHCGQPIHWAGPTGSIDLRAKNLRDVRVVDNVCAEGGAFELATFLDPARQTAEFAERGLVLARNHQTGFHDDTAHPGEFDYGKPYPLRGDGSTWGDPKFLDPARGDFRLAADSPARVAGERGYRGADPDVSSVPERVLAIVSGREALPPPTTAW